LLSACCIPGVFELRHGPFLVLPQVTAQSLDAPSCNNLVTFVRGSPKSAYCWFATDASNTSSPVAVSNYLDPYTVGTHWLYRSS